MEGSATLERTTSSLIEQQSEDTSEQLEECTNIEVQGGSSKENDTCCGQRKLFGGRWKMASWIEPPNKPSQCGCHVQGSKLRSEEARRDAQERVGVQGESLVTRDEDRMTQAHASFITAQRRHRLIT